MYIHTIIFVPRRKCISKRRLGKDKLQDHIHESVCFQLFVYLFAPICHQIKESDLQTFRLENGIKIWQSMWEHRHPIAPCFTTQVKPKPRDVWAKMLKRPRTQFGDVFLGSKYYN